MGWRDRATPVTEEEGSWRDRATPVGEESVAAESSEPLVEIGPAQIETPEQTLAFRKQAVNNQITKGLEDYINKSVPMAAGGGAGVRAVGSAVSNLPRTIVNTPKGVKEFISKVGNAGAGLLTGGPVGAIAGWTSAGPAMARGVNKWAYKKWMQGDGGILKAGKEADAVYKAKKLADAQKAAAATEAFETAATTEGRMMRRMNPGDVTLTSPKTGDHALKRLVKDIDSKVATKAQEIELMKQSSRLKGAKAHKIASESDPAYRSAYHKALTDSEGATVDLPVKNWSVEDYPLADLLKRIGK